MKILAKYQQVAFWANHGMIYYGVRKCTFIINKIDLGVPQNDAFPQQNPTVVDERYLD